MTAAETRTPTPTIEVRSIDWVPEDERHGKVWQQGPFWFLGNFQFFTIALGFTGPLVGLSVWASCSGRSSWRCTPPRGRGSGSLR
jgi:purine-cytosine permease-like protein